MDPIAAVESRPAASCSRRSSQASITSSNAPLIHPDGNMSPAAGTTGHLRSAISIVLSPFCCGIYPASTSDPAPRLPIGQPQLQARNRFELPLIPHDGADLSLLTALTASPSYSDLVSRMMEALASPTDVGIGRVVYDLQTELSVLESEIRNALNDPRTSDRDCLAFEVADGRRAAKAFKKMLLDQCSEDLRDLVASRLDASFDEEFLFYFDHAVASRDARIIARDDMHRIKSIQLKGTGYDRVDILAQGEDGSAVLFRSESGCEVVLKIPHFGSRERCIDNPAKEALHMLNAMGAGGHDHVTSLIGTIRENATLYLVTPHAVPGRLEWVDNAIKAAEIEPKLLALMKLTLCRDMVEGVHRLQVNGILHCDLGATNFFVGLDGFCRVADFSRADAFDPEGSSETPMLRADPGTKHGYAAPEYRFGHFSMLRPNSDTYALGLTLYRIVYGQELYGTLVTEPLRTEAFDAETLPPIPVADWPNVDTVALRSLIVDMLRRDPAQRVPLCQALARPVFSDPAIGSKETRRALVDAVFRVRESRRAIPQSPADANRAGDGATTGDGGPAQQSPDLGDDELAPEGLVVAAP